MVLKGFLGHNMELFLKWHLFWPLSSLAFISFALPPHSRRHLAWEGDFSAIISNLICTYLCLLVVAIVTSREYLDYTGQH
jgi:hypothetical protein